MALGMLHKLHVEFMHIQLSEKSTPKGRHMFAHTQRHRTQSPRKSRLPLVYTYYISPVSIIHLFHCAIYANPSSELSEIFQKAIQFTTYSSLKESGESKTDYEHLEEEKQQGSNVSAHQKAGSLPDVLLESQLQNNSSTIIYKEVSSLCWTFLHPLQLHEGAVPHRQNGNHQSVHCLC